MLDSIDQFLGVICFPAFSIHIWRRKILSEPLNWSNFGNVNRVLRLLYENDIFLVDVAGNDFAVMIASQICPEVVITAVVIATDVYDEMTANALVQVSLLIDS